METAAKAFTPNPEADLRSILKERTEAGATIYGEIRAAAESGWDFSSRWLKGGDGLETIRTRDVMPVDLNAFLYKAERRLAAFYARLGQQDDAARFAEKARTRRDLMNATFWDPARKRWRDVLKDGTYASLGSFIIGLRAALGGHRAARRRRRRPRGEPRGVGAGPRVWCSSYVCDHGRAVGRAERVAAARGHAGGGPAGARPRRGVATGAVDRHGVARVGQGGLRGERRVLREARRGRARQTGAGGEYAPQDGRLDARRRGGDGGAVPLCHDGAVTNMAHITGTRRRLAAAPRAARGGSPRGARRRRARRGAP